MYIEGSWANKTNMFMIMNTFRSLAFPTIPKDLKLKTKSYHKLSTKYILKIPAEKS